MTHKHQIILFHVSLCSFHLAVRGRTSSGPPVLLVQESHLLSRRRMDFHDEALKVDVRFSLGFAKPGPKDPLAIRAPLNAGFGGSFGFADPEAKIGYGYVPNLMNRLLGGPRDIALRTAMYRSIGETDPYHEWTTSVDCRVRRQHCASNRGESKWQRMELYQR